MPIYLILGMKNIQVGTKSDWVETGEFEQVDPNDFGWGVEMKPVTKHTIVPWFKDVPHVYGVFSFDPSEKHKDKIAQLGARVVYFEQEDITNE